MSRYYLSFHTIFILDENIKWLEEFIIYYLYLGFEHFYLYDNEKTTGGDGTQTENKYGFKIDVNNNDNNQMLLNNILNKYNKYITYIKWQPRNNNNEIVYGQTEGIKHFIKNYGNETEWIAFLDLDEFIFSPKNINIIKYLKDLPQKISCIKITQKKFKDRFLIEEKKVIKNYSCINKEIGFEWAPKNIVRTKDFIDIQNIHIINVKNEILYEKPDILRFNHYNVNDKLLKWMKGFYNSDTDYSLDGYDNSMIRYNHLFKNNNNYLFILLLIYLFIMLGLLFKIYK